jgi:MFS family permease
MIGAAVGAWIQDRTGRRWTLCIGGLISIAAIATCYVSDLAANPQATLLGGKLLEGVAVGFIITSTQTYLSEVVPSRLRGPVFALFPVLTLFGQLVAALVVLGQLKLPGKTSYRVALASEWPFSAVPLVLAFVLPESPAWLLQKDNISAARESFRKLHGAKVALAHQDLFEEMHRAVAEERRAANDAKATYLECFRGTNLRRTMIVVFANIIEELFGLTLLGHVSYFLQLIGLSHSASFIILILGVLLGLISNIGSFWTLLKFGRRILTLITLSVVTVFWLSMGIAGCFSGTGVA